MLRRDGRTLKGRGLGAQLPEPDGGCPEKSAQLSSLILSDLFWGPQTDLVRERGPIPVLALASPPKPFPQQKQKLR